MDECSQKLDDIKVRYFIVSTETNPVVEIRAKKLNISARYGCKDKLSIVKEIANKGFIQMSEVAYMGNDINDIECLEVVGFPIVVADAYPEVCDLAKYQTKRLGGYGAVREVCDLLYKYQVKG